MVGSTRLPMIAHFKEPEESEQEQGLYSVSALQGAWTQLRHAPKHVLVVMVLVVLGFELATMRVVQWTAARRDVYHLERQNAALRTNLTILRHSKQVGDLRLAQAQQEVQTRERECSELHTELLATEAQAATLRRNLSLLKLQRSVEGDELQERYRELEGMRAEISSLMFNNSALRENVSQLEEQQVLYKQELDVHYRQFIDMRAKMRTLEQENSALRLSLAGLQRRASPPAPEPNASELTPGLATATAVRAELVRENGALRANLSRLERFDEMRSVEQTLAKRALDQRYEQFVEMRGDIEKLERRRVALRSEIAGLRREARQGGAGAAGGRPS